MRRILQGVGDILTINAGKNPSKVALIDYSAEKPLSCTYRQLNERVNRLANGLLCLGIQKGQKVAYLFCNGSHFLECHFAVSKVGAVGVPLNFRLATRELAYQIDHSDAECFIYAKEFQDSIQIIRAGITKVRHFICAAEEDKDCAYELLLRDSDPSEPEVDVGIDDENVILYTAGTTGNPKGVVLTHKNCLFNALVMAIVVKAAEMDITQIIPPLFHSASLNSGTLRTILMGGTLVLHRKFDPQEMLRAIQERKISHTWGPATLWASLLKYPDLGRYDLSSIRLVSNGAQYMPAMMRKDVLAHFPNAGMTDTYGLTEASPCVTALLPEDVFKKPSSVGRPLPICEVRVVKENGQEAPFYEAGEIVTRGNFMRCYYKNPEETARTIVNGWLYTGDVGYLDEEGFLYLVDRKKDIIVTGGENVYSKEVEEVILLHPQVSEVAVVGLPDEKWGEAVTAFVVALSGAEISESELIGFCKKHLAAYKCPKKINLVDNLPKSAMGKILKRKLRDNN